MTELLTLFGSDLKDLNYKQLEREWRSQKHILHLMRSGRTQMVTQLEKRIAKEEAGLKKKWSKQIQEDKIMLLEIYVTHLESMVEELEYWMSKREEPLWNANPSKPTKTIKAKNIQRKKKSIQETKAVSYWKQSLARDEFAVSWDKEKFLQIARDRGYQTEIALVHDVDKELNLGRAKAQMILNNGRFTWGQVLCLGAMLQMTPREFCDTFLAGYFIEHNDDEYRADYKNVKREELLKTPIRPKDPMEGMVEVQVGADGKPEDEEVWFD